jgi:6-phosphogluconolactonase
MAATITRLADPEAVGRYAARELVHAAREAIIARGVAHLCLAGGSTPMRCYELLDELMDDWTGVHLWYGDERCVPFDDPQSNHGQASARLRAPGATWHPMPGPEGPHVGAARYSEELGSTVLDYVHLGMGPDGHTCSLFPNHPLLEATGVAVGIEDSPKPPPKRITLTLPKLNESRRLVLLVNGADKAAALARGLGEPDPLIPISLLDRHKLEVVADRAALGDPP